jgi:hypothetical protein
MVTSANGIMFFIFTCMHIWVWGILRRWTACAPTAFEVVRNIRKFEEHCFKATAVMLHARRTSR